MYAPVSKSIPYLTIARHHGIGYGAVLLFVDWYSRTRENWKEVDKYKYWHEAARHAINRHLNGAFVISDIMETVDRMETERLASAAQPG